MAGGELWGVWAQTVTNDTGAANVEKYGEIEDMAEAYRDGFAKDFCDGQTSPTPPRWPDDGMQLIYTYDPESARLISEFLRGDIGSRAAAGELNLPVIPTWGESAGFPALNTTILDLRDTTQAAADVMASPEASAEALEEWGRNIYDTAENVDDIPEGWYVHGRNGREDLNTGHVIQFSRNWDVADQYAGRSGSVWMARPADNARVLDFVDPNGADMNRLVETLVTDIKTYLDDPDEIGSDYGNLLSEVISGMEGGLGEHLADLYEDDRIADIEAVIRSSFAPADIVNEAEAYDNPYWYNVLYEVFGYGPSIFVHTPDGAVALDPAALLAVRVH